MRARVVASFGCGLLFALGLGLSGMTHPQRILGFLDLFGTWDPTLMFTMAGAIGVHLPLLWLIRRRAAPVLDTTFHLPTKRDLDARLIGGSALFGVGWALGGFCPGPALVSVLGGRSDNVLFLFALLLGMALQSALSRSPVHRSWSMTSRSQVLPLALLAGAVVLSQPRLAQAYPPGVAILGKSRNCLACHPSNGPWSDESRTIVDLLDAGTKKSLRRPDGTFQIEAARNQPRTILTVIGRVKGDPRPPAKNAWLFVDPSQIETGALSKFAPGWDVNLPMACRLVGDKLPGHDGESITVLPMTVRPSDRRGAQRRDRAPGHAHGGRIGEGQARRGPGGDLSREEGLAQGGRRAGIRKVTPNEGKE